MEKGMDYREHIEKVIDYIEENLQCEVNLTDCARVSGYSSYHFLRIFRDAVGLTPADYIRKRRISEICKEIMRGNQCISPIAFRYGFNSQENFLRAFKTEHHILPTEYREAGNSLKLYERFRFEAEDFSVKPGIVEIQPFSLTVYQCDEAAVPNFWNKYNARGLSRVLSGGKEVWDYGVSSWDYEEKRLDYYIGIPSEYAAGSREGTLELYIPGGIYAVFSTPAADQDTFVTQIHKTWDYIREWFSGSGYERRRGYEFECYREKSRLFSEDIYIPVEMEEVHSMEAGAENRRIIT